MCAGRCPCAVVRERFATGRAILPAEKFWRVQVRIVRMRCSGSPLRALQKGSLLLALAVMHAVQPVSGASAAWNEKAIRDNLNLVAGWQMAHPKKHSPLDWTYGAFYSGLVQYGLALPEGGGLQELRRIGEKRQWATLPRLYHADNHAVGHAWLEMAMEDGNPAIAGKMRAVLDTVMMRPSSASLQFGTPGCQDRWCWSDALFMSPPVFAKMASYTGDFRYLDFMDREYKAACNYLFDGEEGLFFRDSRYFAMPAANGRKMFWSRGNGWVMAGLPLILRDMPLNRPERVFYVNLLKRMAAAVKQFQAPDGSWHASLMDPDEPPLKEMSGTLFMMYGLMWGVNQGYLNAADYLPVIRKAWQAACDAVDEEGALGWVQPIADKPGHYSEHDTEVYGSGAYLLAGTELRKWVIGQAHSDRKTVIVTNPLKAFRPRETVSVPWQGDHGRDASLLRVFDVRDGRVIPHQMADTDGDGRVDTLLFQSNMMAGGTRTFWVFESCSLGAARAEQVCFSRHVPERLDDFAWENDLTAHRIYGLAVSRPAPEGEGLVSSGTDVWSKRPGTRVINEFYQKGDYHRDHGKGLDMYNVGPGRGCGGIAVFRDGRAHVSGNWSRAATLYNGPVQTAFEVRYEPWDLGGGVRVAETRRVTLDAGSRFTRVCSTFRIEGDKKIRVGVGMDTGGKRNSYEAVAADRESGVLSAWSRPEKENGSFGTAVIAPWMPNGCEKDGEGCAYWTCDVGDGASFDWYMGAVWDKASAVKSPEQWVKEVQRVRECLRNPLRVKVH